MKEKLYRFGNVTIACRYDDPDVVVRRYVDNSFMNECRLEKVDPLTIRVDDIGIHYKSAVTLKKHVYNPVFDSVFQIDHEFMDIIYVGENPIIAIAITEQSLLLMKDNAIKYVSQNIPLKLGYKLILLRDRVFDEGVKDHRVIMVGIGPSPIELVYGFTYDVVEDTFVGL